MMTLAISLISPAIPVRDQMELSTHLFTCLPLPVRDIPPSPIFHCNLSYRAGFFVKCIIPAAALYISNPAYNSIVLAIDTTNAEQVLRFAVTFIHAYYIRAEAVKLLQSATTCIHSFVHV